MTISSPAIILIAPQMGENIGAAARACGNFGLNDLRLVAPRDGWPNDQAIAMAAGAMDDLVRVTVFDDFETAVADIGVLLATTARLRDMVKPVYTPQTAMQHLCDKAAQHTKAGILFGRERNGLENQEVARAHGIINVPTNPAFPSINLAQSVLLMAYEWAQQSQIYTAEEGAVKDESILATQSDLQNFLGRLENALDEKGFFRDNGLRPHMLRNITNIFSRGELTVQEVNTLQGIISALIRRQ